MTTDDVRARLTGPGGPFELHGAPRVVRPPRTAQDTELAAALWDLSETVTAVTFP